MRSVAYNDVIGRQRDDVLRHDVLYEQYGGEHKFSVRLDLYRRSLLTLFKVKLILNPHIISKYV